MTLAPTLVASLLIPIRTILGQVPFLVANIAEVRLLALLGQMTRFWTLIAAVFLLGALSSKVTKPDKWNYKCLFLIQVQQLAEKSRNWIHPISCITLINSEYLNSCFKPADVPIVPSNIKLTCCIWDTCWCHILQEEGEVCCFLCHKEEHWQVEVVDLCKLHSSASQRTRGTLWQSVPFCGEKKHFRLKCPEILLMVETDLLHL